MKILHKQIAGTILRIIVFCCLVTSALAAQPLDVLIAELRANNPALKALNNEHLAALERAPQLSQLPDPEFGIGAFPLPVETRLGPQQLRLSATQMFPWFGTLKQKSTLATTQAEAVYERIDARSLNLIFELKQAYYKLYELRQSQTIIQRKIVLMETLEQLALTKVESGKSTIADVLLVQLQSEELRQQLIILQTAEADPLAQINQICKREQPDAPVDVDLPLAFTDLPFDKTTLLDRIGTTHPLLRGYQKQQQAAQQAIALNALNAKPAFGLGLDYIMVSDRENATITDNGRDILMLRATVKVPLFRDQYRAKEREENFRIQALQHQQTDALNMFSTAIEQAYTQHEIAQEQLTFYQKQIQTIKAILPVLESDYSTKGGGFTELLQLEKKLIDYELQTLKAIVQSHLAKSKVEQFVTE